MASSHFPEAMERIRTRQAKVGVIGLGYVGLPLVRIFAQAGFPVLGFDCDLKKVEMLSARQSYIRHIGSDAIAEIVDSGRFEATADMTRLAECSAILICVPTPLTSARDPDMTFVEQTSRQIAAALKPGQLVVLESTTYPGTTRDVVVPILERAGLKAGPDFFVAYSPEREDPGNVEHTAARLPKVVGGLDPESHQLAVELYRPVVAEVVSVSSPEVAEACKILENTYRCVNIALVNELKILFERMQIDVWEVIAAASTKPFGFQAFYPGPGLGGHCIPIDPFYLSWVARKHHFNTRFIELAGEINTAMPEYVVHRVGLALNQHGRAIRGSRICILGMAYKKDVDDERESPSFELMDRLEDLGAIVCYNDPYIPKLKPTRKYHFVRESAELTPEFLASQDCVLLSTDHSCYDMDFIVEHSRILVDTRNAAAKVRAGREKVWKA